MMQWVGELWSHFVRWMDHLGPREAVVLGALAMLVVGGIGKHVFLPFSRWLVPRITEALFRLASGSTAANRLWLLPRYLAKVEEETSRVRNPWLSDRHRLREILVPVAMKPQTAPGTRMDLLAVVRQFRSSVILGDPGSGKTTALKSIALDCIEGRLVDADGSPLIPVFIELRRLAESQRTLDEFITDQFRLTRFVKPDRFVRSLRRGGKLALFLDAIDEVDEGLRKSVFQQLERLLRTEARSAGCRVYITTRPVAYDGQLADLTHATLWMADLTPAQIRRYVLNWDFRPPRSGATLLNSIMSRRPILDICLNPLMLSIVTSLYRETDYELPESRNEFYRVCIEALLRRWDAVKQLDHRNNYPAVLKEAFLQRLAFAMLVGGHRSLSGTDVQRSAEDFFAERGRREATPEAFVDEIVRSGILSRLPTGEMFLAHMTLAESLAASFLRGEVETLAELWQRSPTMWREVCMLYVADARANRHEIGRLLGAARERSDVSGHLLVAADAHWCPDAEQRWAINSAASADSWEFLEQRAIIALTRFGDMARPALMAMLETGSPQVRGAAILALGRLESEWARSALGAALSDDSTRHLAAEALSGAGDAGLASIERLITSNYGNEPVVRAAIEALAMVGSREALEYVAALIWHPNPLIAELAAITVADLRRADWLSLLTTTAHVMPPRDAAFQELLSWAVQDGDGLPEGTMPLARAIYVIGRAVERWEGRVSRLVPVFMNLPRRVLVPVLIQAFESFPDRMADADAWLDDEHRRGWRLPSLQNLVRLLAGVPPRERRAVWSRAKPPDRRDWAIEGEGPITWLVSLSGAAALFPLAVASVSGAVGWWWWLWVVVPAAGLAWAVVGKEETYWSLLLAPLLPLGAGRAPLRQIFEGLGWRTKVARISWIMTAATGLVATLVSIVALGTIWLSCLVPACAQLFADWHEGALVFRRRSNPLLGWCQSWDTITAPGSLPPLIVPYSGRRERPPFSPFSYV